MIGGRTGLYRAYFFTPISRLLVFGFVFVLGIFVGGLLSLGAADVALSLTTPYDTAGPLHILFRIWRCFCWSAAAFLLSLTELRTFLLYPLVLFRGVLFSVSFLRLFVSEAPIAVLVRYGLLSVLVCAPFLLLAALGVSESTNLLAGGSSLSSRVYLLILIASLLLCIVFVFAELWLLPNFAFCIQPTI